MVFEETTHKRQLCLIFYLKKWSEIFIKSQSELCTRIESIRLRKTSFTELSAARKLQILRRYEEAAESRRQMVQEEISKPKIISCINGTVEDGRDIFHEKYPGVIMNLVLKYLYYFC